jgi:hypothetical protein
VLKRSEAILQTARLCGTPRLMFDSEELSLSCQSTNEMDGVGACITGSSSSSAAGAGAGAALHASPNHNESASVHGRRKSRRVVFTEPPGESVHLTSSHLESPTECKKPPEFPQSSTADEQSLYYR